MFHGPTELLWIGCLKGLIWTQKIQIRYIDTKHQLADMLTKGNNNFLHLLKISHFSSTSLISCSIMAKRVQNQKEEERVVSKSRPAVMNTSGAGPRPLPIHRGLVGWRWVCFCPLLPSRLIHHSSLGLSTPSFFIESHWFLSKIW